MEFYLAIIIDTTGSMQSWIDVLNSQIINFIQMSTLTCTFTKINIISYSDYDQPNPVISTGWCFINDNKIINFCKNLKSKGGGDIPECTKTALYDLMNNLQIDDNIKVYALHLTDSCAHDYQNVKKNINSEGYKELTYLGEQQFSWLNIFNRMKLLKITYIILTSCSYSPYAILSYYTDGFYILTSPYKLKEILITVFNKMFGCDEDYEYIYDVDINKTKIYENEIELLKNTEIILKEKSIKQLLLANSLMDYKNKILNDKDLRKNCFDIFEHIIENNIMILTVNRIFGKIWREICKLRNDPNKEKLLELMNKNKIYLNYENKNKFDEWLKNSYNSLIEIKDIIIDFEKNNNIYETVKYIKDTNDKTNPKILINSFMDCNNNFLKEIKNFFGRLIINKNVNTTNDSTSIPLNMPVSEIFSLILHLKCSGTQITGLRNISILALLARNTVLDEYANTFLQNNKGKWLNFNKKTYDSVEIPENFSLSFIHLLKNNFDILTDYELNVVDSILDFNFYRNLLNINVYIKIKNISCFDNKYEEYKKQCNKCNNDCPISLLNNNNICGYCIFNMSFPQSFNMIKCIDCHSFYSRDSCIETNILNNKCYYCRRIKLADNTWKEIEKPIITICKLCDNKYICNKMENDTCYKCFKYKTKFEITYEKFTVKIKELFNNKLNILESKLGYSNLNGDVNIISMFLRHKKHTVINEINNLKYNKMDIHPDIYDTINEIFEKRTIIKDTCDLCCEYSTNLTLSCGRRKCSSKLCGSCINSWYKINKKGFIINTRHLTCMFCNRKPSPKIIKKYFSENAINLYGNYSDPKLYYAWCSNCNMIEDCGNRECGNFEIPNIFNFKCKLCSPTNSYEQLKHCPNCDVLIQRIDGCNHITCVCSIHWCFVCAKEFEKNTIYEHMTNTHGSIYTTQNDDKYIDDDEYIIDDEY